MSCGCENEYMPMLARIADIKVESLGDRPIRTFTLELIDSEKKEGFTFLPGQCMLIGVLGYGESMFAISSSPTIKGSFQVSVMRHGKVTKRLHASKKGDVLTVRGPYGNHFPLEEWKKKDLLFVGGGIGQAPLRSVIGYVLDEKKRRDYGRIDIVYGASDSGALCFLDELDGFSCLDDVDVHISVDCSDDNTCRYFIGYVPDNLKSLDPKPSNRIVLTCGPPAMIQYVLEYLEKRGFSKSQVYTTLEERMKCGIGKCGRCNIGGIYICRDGPVFSAEQISSMKGDF